MRVYYHLSRYISHRLSGLDYIDCLRLLGHEVLLDPSRADAADMAVLHDAPERYPSILEQIPALRNKRLAAFCVWENEVLPKAYVEPLQAVQEVWTPSRFSRQSMLARFPHAKLLPHVARRVSPSEGDLRFARETLKKQPGEFIFFSVIDAVNPRKNARGLLSAFARLRALSGPSVRLVLKQYRAYIDYSSLPGVSSIEGDLSEGQMAALHVLSDAYVSAHHAEGWGLGLSQAMAYGKPVIATGYSGNMDYMDEENSLPVRHSMVPVSQEMADRIPLFTTDMLWAAPDEDHFVSCMLRAAGGRLPTKLRANAALICERFGKESVCRILRELLECSDSSIL